MHTTDIIEQLKIARQNPRKMHKSWLQQNGLFQFIEENTSGVGFEKWNMRNKIDLLVSDASPMRCYCNGPHFVKPGQEVCSQKCAANMPEFKQIMSDRQKNNAAERMAKTKQTFLERYGVASNAGIPSVIENNRNKRIIRTTEKRKQLFESNGLDYDLLNDVSYLSKIRDQCTSLSELSTNHFNSLSIVFVQRHYAAKSLETYPMAASVGENELALWISSICSGIERNNRQLIKPLELDILLPHHNLAIEFDGMYWHSTKKDTTESVKTRHLHKTELVEKLGIQLLHVFESEWHSKKDIVKSIIRSKLGMCSTIYARKTDIVLVTPKDAREFFDRTHIQGFTPAQYYIGLRHENELVMCVSIGKSRFDNSYEYELIRFSTKLDTRVTGGFQKLLKYIRNNLTQAPILTYCDRRYSTGLTYSRYGKFLGNSEPGYSWYNNQTVLSRYQTQKSKLAKLFPKHFSNDRTEKEIMESAGYFQLYDCGNMKFEL